MPASKIKFVKTRTLPAKRERVNEKGLYARII